MNLFTDEVLLDYVQQRLSPTMSQKLERVIQNDPELALRVKNLRCGELPYTAAFVYESLPPVPTHLMEQVRLWGRLSMRSISDAASLSQKQQAQFLGAKLGARWRALSLKGIRTGILSALGLSVVLSFGTGVGVSTWVLSSKADDTNSWTTAVALYQRLYQRETLEAVNFDAPQTHQLLVDLQQRYGMHLRVPDLQPEGLELKRVQFLALGQKPIVQIAYMPRVGTPIALCVTLSGSRDDQAIHHKEYAGQHMLVWRQQGISYLLIGTQSEQELRQFMPKLQSALWS